MKVIKLNRRFRQFKEHGHTVALRFDYWNPATIAVYEKICRARLRGHGYDRNADWAGYFGHAINGNTYRPYWITFRREADLTLVLLSADLTKKP